MEEFNPNNKLQALVHVMVPKKRYSPGFNEASTTRG